MQCSQFHMTLRSCPGLLQDSSWAAAQPLSTSSHVDTRVYSPLNNLGSESPWRKLIHCSWRMSWPNVPCHRTPQISPCLMKVHCWLQQLDCRFHLPEHSWMLAQDRPAVFKQKNSNESQQCKPKDFGLKLLPPLSYPPNKLRQFKTG